MGTRVAPESPCDAVRRTTCVTKTGTYFSQGFPMEISRDQAQLIIERGQRAQTLLDDETFIWVVEDQTAYHVAGLVACRPHIDRDARDYHHSLQHALSELVATLKGHAEAGAAMEKALAEAAEEEEDDTI